MENDIHLEKYWYNFFKKSIYNFCNNHQLSYLLQQKLPLEKWSQELNILQKQLKYDRIEYLIYEYILDYGKILIEFNGDSRDCDIYYTNIKRWNKISLYKINSMCDDYNYFRIYKYLIDNNVNSVIINYIKQRNNKKILDYILEYNYGNLMDYFKMISNINEIISINKSMKGHKIIKLLKQHFD